MPGEFFMNASGFDEQQYFEAICNRCSFDSYEMLVLETGSLRANLIKHIHNLPDDLCCAYEQQRMHEHDPRVLYGLQNHLPRSWAFIQGMFRNKNVKGSNMAEVFDKALLTDGVCIPIKASQREVVIICFGVSSERLKVESVLNENIEKAVQSIYADFAKIIAWVRETYLVCQNSGESTCRITAREKECIFWACEGKTSWEISKIAGISERTVTFHLNNVAKKLGASNRQHAVARAILTGLVSPVMRCAVS